MTTQRRPSICFHTPIIHELSLFNQDSKKKKHEEHLEGGDAKALDIPSFDPRGDPKPPQLEPGGASALPKPSRSSKEVLPIHTNL